MEEEWLIRLKSKSRVSQPGTTYASYIINEFVFDVSAVPNVDFITEIGKTLTFRYLEFNDCTFTRQTWPILWRFFIQLRRHFHFAINFSRCEFLETGFTPSHALFPIKIVSLRFSTCDFQFNPALLVSMFDPLVPIVNGVEMLESLDPVTNIIVRTHLIWIENDHDGYSVADILRYPCVYLQYLRELNVEYFWERDEAREEETSLTPDFFLNEFWPIIAPHCNEVQAFVHAVYAKDGDASRAQFCADFFTRVMKKYLWNEKIVQVLLENDDDHDIEEETEPEMYAWIQMREKLEEFMTHEMYEANREAIRNLFPGNVEAQLNYFVNNPDAPLPIPAPRFTGIVEEPVIVGNPVVFSLCPSCYLPYDELNHKKMAGTVCGHVFCSAEGTSCPIPRCEVQNQVVRSIYGLDMIRNEDGELETQCQICTYAMDDQSRKPIMSLVCGHVFCKICFTRIMNEARRQCPVDRRSLVGAPAYVELQIEFADSVGSDMDIYDGEGLPDGDHDMDDFAEHFYNINGNE